MAEAVDDRYKPHKNQITLCINRIKSIQPNDGTKEVDGITPSEESVQEIVGRF